MRSEQSDRKTSGERQPETGGVSTVFLRRVFSLSLTQQMDLRAPGVGIPFHMSSHQMWL